MKNQAKNNAITRVILKIIDLAYTLIGFLNRCIEYKLKKKEIEKQEKKELDTEIKNNNEAIENGDIDHMTEKIKEYWNLEKGKKK